VCIPTVSGREQALVNAIRSIAKYTESDWNVSLVRDAPSAGVGWNLCADKLEYYPDTTHLFFFNDDATVFRGWLPPMVEACDRGMIPAPRVEPAGGHCTEQIFQTHPPMPPDEYPVPRDKNAYWYADHAENQPQEDWAPVPTSNMPFCSVEQWRNIGVFPPIHYGSDCWFAHRARECGYPVVARMDAVIANFNINCGRHKVIDGVEYNEQSYLDYDGVFALPKYLRGELKPTEADPLRETPEGLRIAQEWRKGTFG
jgi:hypothetical protein